MFDTAQAKYARNKMRGGDARKCGPLEKQIKKQNEKSRDK